MIQGHPRQQTETTICYLQGFGNLCEGGSRLKLRSSGAFGVHCREILRFGKTCKAPASPAAPLFWGSGWGVNCLWEILPHESASQAHLSKNKTYPSRRIPLEGQPCNPPYKRCPLLSFPAGDSGAKMNVECFGN